MYRTALRRTLAGLTSLCLLLSLLCVPAVAADTPLNIISDTALTAEMLTGHDAVNITGGATQAAAVTVTLNDVDASGAPITTAPDTYTNLVITGAAASATVTITSVYDRVSVDKAAADAGHVTVKSDIPSVWTVTKTNGDKIYYGSNAYAVLCNDAYAVNTGAFEFRLALNQTTAGDTAYDVWQTGPKHLIYDLYLYTPSVGTRFADYSMTVDTVLLGTPVVTADTTVFGNAGEYGGVSADGSALRVTYFNTADNGLIGHADAETNPNGTKLATLDFTLAAGCEQVDDVLVLGSGTAPVTEAATGDMVTSPAYSQYATTSVSFTQDYTLYDLEISYKNGGVGTVTDAFYGDMTGLQTHYLHTESSVTLPTTTAAGYQFNGWYSAATFPDGGTYLTSLDTSTKTSQTVYAIWAPYTYKIVYNLGGGDALTATPTEYTSGGTVTLPTPTRTGYEFAGWYSAAEGGTLFADSKLTASNFHNGLTSYTEITGGYSGEINVYARWTAEQYTVTYLDKGGTAFSGTNGDALTTAHTYGTDTVLVSPEKTGYTLKGLYTDAGGTAALPTNAESKYYLAAAGYTANITLYAEWQINRYTISFNSKGGSAVTAITQYYGTTVTAPTDPTRMGYEFAGWYATESYAGDVYSFTVMPAESFTLYAKWTPVSSALSNITYQDANTSVTAKASLVFYSDPEMRTPIDAAPTASTVYVKAMPTNGYVVSSVTVGGVAVELTRQPDGSYTGSFTMPDTAPAIAAATHVNIEIAYFVTTDSGTTFFKPFSAYGAQTLIMFSYADGLNLKLNGLPVYTVSGQYDVSGTGIRCNQAGDGVFVSKAVTLADLSLTTVAASCESPSDVAAYLWRFAELSNAAADGSMSYAIAARANGGYNYDANAVEFTAAAGGGYAIDGVTVSQINGCYDIAKGAPLNYTPETQTMLAGDLATPGAENAIEIGQDGQLTVADVLLLIAAYQVK